MSATWRILEGDARDRLNDLPAGSVQTVVTSPPLEPYFGLRDYGTGEWEGGDPACDHLGGPQQSSSSTLAGNGHGGEKPLSPALQAQAVPFKGTCGKCAAVRTDHQIGLEASPDEFVAALVEVFRAVRRVLRDDGTVWLVLGDSFAGAGYANRDLDGHGSPSRAAGGKRRHGSTTYAKSKDLLGVPWLVAFALRADGWYLRSDIIWAKPNPMPESVTDRPRKSEE